MGGGKGGEGREGGEKARGERGEQGKVVTSLQAFGVYKASRGKRVLQRNLDRSHLREHVALKSRELDVSAPPPAVVVVMGPPGVGKTTLIKSLVREFSRQALVRVRGPVTVVANKRRRLTFVECPDDIHAMLDLAKVADLALLMVDASFGFEMETFEFLNMLHVHGMPKVMGVLTHLDQFRSAKTLKRVKKELKHRFWVETHDGAKLFQLNGVTKAGNYPKNEIHNLALFLSRMKYRPIAWRIQHPYILCDRMEVRVLFCVGSHVRVAPSQRPGSRKFPVRAGPDRPGRVARGPRSGAARGLVRLRARHEPARRQPRARVRRGRHVHLGGGRPGRPRAAAGVGEAADGA